MTSIRASAYRRVIRTLTDLGPAKLWPTEQACIRDAADSLLFCIHLEQDDARHALAAVAALIDGLVDADRWTPRRAQQLLDDVWGCGPAAAFDVPMAA